LCSKKTQAKGQTSHGWPQKPQQASRSQESGAGAGAMAKSGARSEALAM